MRELDIRDEGILVDCIRFSTSTHNDEPNRVDISKVGYVGLLNEESEILCEVLEADLGNLIKALKKAEEILDERELLY